MEEKLIEKTKKSIETILEGDISPNNIEYLYKLSKVNHMAKEDKNMYSEYGARRPGYDSYGRDGNYGKYGNYGEYGRGNYGARGRDSRYRGDEYMDRISNEYGRYMENRQRYGAGDQETDKSFHYMVKALEDFIMVLYEEAETPQQKQQLMQSLQNSMR